MAIASWYLNKLMRVWIKIPIPPAPTKPRIEEARIPLSKEYSDQFISCGINCGTIPCLIICKSLAPQALSPSKVWFGISSIESAKALAKNPVKAINKAITATIEPIPKIYTKTLAQITTGIFLNKETNPLILIRSHLISIIFLDIKKANNKETSVAKHVATTAKARVWSKSGMISGIIPKCTGKNLLKKKVINFGRLWKRSSKDISKYHKPKSIIKRITKTTVKDFLRLSFFWLI